MANLIITMMAIALFVVLSLFGVFEINPDIVHSVETEEIIESGFVDLVADYHAYKINNNDSDLKDANWTNFINVPAAPINTAWSYGSTLNGNYFCLSGVMNSSQDFSNTSTLLKSNFNTVFVNNNCGATSDDTGYINGAAKAFTIWLDSDYISEGSAINNDNVYKLSVDLKDEDSGLSIAHGGSISFYKNTDVFIEIDLSKDGVVASHSNVADTNIAFVCADGSDGCNSGANRRIKINASEVYENRKLTLTFDYNGYSLVRDIYLSAIDLVKVTEEHVINNGNYSTHNIYYSNLPVKYQNIIHSSYFAGGYSYNVVYIYNINTTNKNNIKLNLENLSLLQMPMGKTYHGLQVPTYEGSEDCLIINGAAGALSDVNIPNYGDKTFTYNTIAEAENIEIIYVSTNDDYSDEDIHNAFYVININITKD
jgi:hypothetical protein